MTEKLYEKDAYLSRFSATVLKCEQIKKAFAIVLNQTSFFPEGGGQASDVGTIDNARVFDVQIENGVIYHYTDQPFNVGDTVKCEIDFNRRFTFMQNHTGEHVVSGVAHKLFGVNNVGFHLGEDLVTIDFDKELTRENLDQIEYIANQKIWKNLYVKAYYPTQEELNNTEYRSKKEIEGAVRLVEIDGTDICACCAPHVKSTGEIGIIKLLDCERMRGGIRIVLKCGAFALCDYRTKYENVSKISAMLSSKQENAAEAVELLDRKFNAEKQRNTELKRKAATLIADNSDKSSNCVFADDCDMNDLQFIADRLHKSRNVICGAFSGNDNNYSFAICGEEVALQKFFEKFKNELTVRGGGRNGMVQGSVMDAAEKIKLYF